MDNRLRIRQKSGIRFIQVIILIHSIFIRRKIVITVFFSEVFHRLSFHGVGAIVRQTLFRLNIRFFQSINFILKHLLLLINLILLTLNSNRQIFNHIRNIIQVCTALWLNTLLSRLQITSTLRIKTLRTGSLKL